MCYNFTALDKVVLFMNKYQELAETIFPEITSTIADLEKKYPERVLPEGAMVTRFAPSPTGFLHTGSLFTSLICRKFATQTNGVFFIRLEDTDTKREIQGAGDALLKELAAFNNLPDEGYFGDSKPEVGAYGPYIQSQRDGIYKIVIKEFIAKGFAYPCFCSTQELADLRVVQEAEKIRPGYYGEYAKCRYIKPEDAIEKIKNGEPYVIRFKSQGSASNYVHVKDLIRGELNLTENDQDIVIYKSDGLPTYHFAHLVDDHFMHTTNVIRGEEWLPSLPIHLELFATAGWKAPEYAHLPVIMKVEDGNRRKLSKRKDPEAAVSYFLSQGYPEDGFIEYLMTVANSNFEEWRFANLDKKASEFTMTFDKMSLDGALFDLDKVKNICKELLSRISAEEITDRIYKWAKVYDLETVAMIESDRKKFIEVMNIERGGEKPRKDYCKYDEIKPAISFIFPNEFAKIISNPLPFNEFISNANIIDVLVKCRDNVNLEVSEEEWFAGLKNIGAELGYAPNGKTYKKNPELYKGHIGDVAEIIRIAMCGRKQSPNLYYIMKILGIEEVKARINSVIDKLA